MSQWKRIAHATAGSGSPTTFDTGTLPTPAAGGHYKDLKVVLYLKHNADASSDNTNIRLNDDDNDNRYTWAITDSFEHNSHGERVHADHQQDYNYMRISNKDGHGAGSPWLYVFYITNHTGSGFGSHLLQGQGFTHYQSGKNPRFADASGTWQISSPITKINLMTRGNSNYFQSDSSITVFAAEEPSGSNYPNLTNGTIFEESDTGKHYMFDGTSTWNEIT